MGNLSTSEADKSGCRSAVNSVNSSRPDSRLLIFSLHKRVLAEVDKRKETPWRGSWDIELNKNGTCDGWP